LSTNEGSESEYDSTNASLVPSSEDKERRQQDQDQIRSINLMPNADAVMSHWQVSQAFMRMARRAKDRRIRGAFLKAEQQVIRDLYTTIVETQLLDNKNRDQAIDSPILRERPFELSRLGECFPRTLLSIYSFGRTWKCKVYCERCKKHVPLSQLKVFDLCTRHHECVAVHCLPTKEDLEIVVDPMNLIDLYRRLAIMRSEDDRTGECRSEIFFDRSLYLDPTHNMSTLAQLVQVRSLILT
jgi:hypothetical protein